jgi:hypothetical protein
MFSPIISSISASSTAESTDLTVEDDNSFDNIDVKIFFVATDNPKGVKCNKCSHFWKSINANKSASIKRKVSRSVQNIAVQNGLKEVIG